MIHTMITEYRHTKQVTSLMAGSSQLLAILMSKLRSSLGAAWEQPGSSLEYAYSMLMTTFLRPFSSKRAEFERRLAANEITARPSRDYGSSLTRLRLVVSLLLMLVLGSTSVWGQEGIWYLGNSSRGNATAEEYTYDSGNSANNYYLVPAADPQRNSKLDAFYSGDNYATPGDAAKPFITTYKTDKDDNSIWFISPSGEAGYYYIIHAATGKYLIYEPPHSAATNRKSMHLQVVDDDTYNPSTNVNFSFAITKSGSGYVIRPHEISSGNRFFNAANKNFNFYYGPSGTTYYHDGIVGLYSSGNRTCRLYCCRRGTQFSVCQAVQKDTCSRSPQ